MLFNIDHYGSVRLAFFESKIINADCGNALLINVWFPFFLTTHILYFFRVLSANSLKIAAFNQYSASSYFFGGIYYDSQPERSA